MIRYQKLSYSDAKVIIAEYDSYDDNEFKDLENHWRANDVSASAFDPSYEDFRHELLAEFNSALVETSGKMTYLLDLRVGIKLFQLMPLDSNFSIILSTSSPPNSVGNSSLIISLKYFLLDELDNHLMTDSFNEDSPLYSTPFASSASLMLS